MRILLKNEESTVQSLRGLYSGYGYSQFKMKKFEEYDLYVKNKDFLISEHVITFTDTNGKLMALKPDVTLSIVKNSKDMKGYVEKLYYNENVYRVSKSTKSFKEIMQVGLECIGDVDDYCISEVITLAGKSLSTVSENWVLNISHLGILTAAMGAAGIPEALRGDVIRCIAEKNTHELQELCRQNQISQEPCRLLTDLILTYGSADTVLPKLKALSNREDYLSACEAFEKIMALVDGDTRKRIQVDFSVISDSKYYNGIVLKGYVAEISGSVLSGGQYDTLMAKMGKQSGAIGFAVYLDMLEQMDRTEEKFEQDVIVLYDETTDMQALRRLTHELIAAGSRVTAQRAIPGKLTYRQLIRLKDGEVAIIENNA